MDGFKTYSKSFGDAVNVLVSIMMASMKGKEFESMLLKGSLVEGAVVADKRPDVETKFRKDWGNFAETANQVSKLFGAIREWQNGLSITKDVKFDSMDTLFSNLAGMPDVDLQTEKRLAAVESDNVNVIANIKTLREDFIKDLLVVSQLDLQFSRFKSAVAGMPETMKQVSGVLNGGNSTLVETSTEAAGSGWEKSVMIGGGILVGLVSIVVIILCCLDFRGMRTKTIGLCRKPPKKDNRGTGGDSMEKGGKASRSSSKTSTTKTSTPSSSASNLTDGTANRSSSNASMATPSSSGNSLDGNANRGGQRGAPPTPRVEPNGGAGGSGGGQQVQQVQQEAAPLQNAVQNGAGNNVNAQQSNSTTASTTHDNSTVPPIRYLNDGVDQAEDDPNLDLTTRPVGAGPGPNDITRQYNTLDEIKTEFSDKGPKKN